MRIWNLVVKEFIQLARDWLMTAFILTLPALQLALMAQATGSRVSGLKAAVLDLDHSTASRQVVSLLAANHRELNLCRYPSTREEALSLFDRGEVVLVAIIPTGFEEDLRSPYRVPQVQLITDASNSVAGSVALRGAQAAIAAFSANWQRAQGHAPVVELRPIIRFNPALNVRYFSTSAQVGFIIYQVTLVVASLGLARERELGTLEQLLVMPITRVELIIGKAIPAAILGMTDFFLMLAVAVFGFHVPLRGSLPLLAGLTFLFVIAEIGYGLLISSLAHTQQQAILLVFVLAMVDMTFSGYMVRIKFLPPFLQAVAQAVPFSHYLTIIRGVMLKGVGMGILWPHALAMVATGMVVAGVAVHALGRTLD